MHHTEISPADHKKKLYRIALLGNPNSGKSSVFNQLTGLRQKTGNFPGVTVDKKLGKLRLGDQQDLICVDFPGTYSLYPTSADERIVAEVLTNPADQNYPDLIVYIADVTQLEKHLLLFTQVRDLGIPCILALNMTDIAEKENIQIDVDRLSREWGISIIQISGRTAYNIDQLKAEIGRLCKDLNTYQKPAPFYSISSGLSGLTTKIGEALREDNPYRSLLIAHHFERLSFLTVTQKTSVRELVQADDFKSLPAQVEETMQRFDRFESLIKKVKTTAGQQEETFSDRIDKLLTNRVLGPIIFLTIMLLVFQAIYSWSSIPMDFIEGIFAQLGDWAQAILPESWWRNLLVNGVLAGLGGVLIFIPQIAILFFLIALLEEAGYMARAVFMFDRLMQVFGLSGRSIVALVSGGACAIPAIMSTRTISNFKERLITIMVTPLISCSARIPVYTVLIGLVVPADRVLGVFNLQGLTFMGMYLLGIIAALLSAWVFKKILKSGESSFLMIEMPEYRRPVLKNVFLTVLEKVKTFTFEAGKIILMISIVLWFLASYGPGQSMNNAVQKAQQEAQSQSLSPSETDDLIAAYKIEASYAGYMGKFIEPAIRPLGFDWKMGIALITSFAAREVFVGTMATIYSIGSSEDEWSIRERLAAETDKETGKPVYNMATALSLLIFYVFAMQCMSTLAIVKRETKSWKWPLIQFLYMSAMAYFGSLLVYQLLT